VHRRYLNYWVSPIDLKLGEHLKTQGFAKVGVTVSD